MVCKEKVENKVKMREKDPTHHQRKETMPSSFYFFANKENT